jgi:hypothetical protein
MATRQRELECLSARFLYEIDDRRRGTSEDGWRLQELAVVGEHKVVATIVDCCGEVSSSPVDVECVHSASEFDRDPAPVNGTGDRHRKAGSTLRRNILRFSLRIVREAIGAAEVESEEVIRDVC